MKFCPLFSSSSGNSVYIGSGDEGILIDVGRTAKQVREMLAAIGVSDDSIKAIFITHEHNDHIKGLSVFAAKKKIPVYASAGTILALKKAGVLTEKHTALVIEDGGVEIGDLFVECFKTSHDCADGRGYVVSSLSDATKRVAVCTDTGYVTSDILSAITGARLVYLESNHDVAMLKTGPYQYYLKQRILSNVGHLSNDACAEVLRALVNRGTVQFVLAHLSQENNTPELAYQTAVSALTEMGALVNRDYFLDVAYPENKNLPYIV